MARGPHQRRRLEHARGLFGLEQLGFIYSRTGNPTVDVLERRLAALEGGAGALALGSGRPCGDLQLERPNAFLKHPLRPSRQPDLRPELMTEAHAAA
jgi:hypothetical protein